MKQGSLFFFFPSPPQPNRIIMGSRVVYGYSSHLELQAICCLNKPQPLFLYGRGLIFARRMFRSKREYLRYETEVRSITPVVVRPAPGG